MTFFFVVAHLATPLTCWLISAFALKRRIQWLRLFILACIVGYVFLMLVLASHAVRDSLTRQNVDAGAVFGEGEASDAGLALAPVLGIPVTIFWTAFNFIVLSVVEWCFRTDFRSFFFRSARAEHAAKPEPPKASDPCTGDPVEPPRSREDDESLDAPDPPG